MCDKGHTTPDNVNYSWNPGLPGCIETTRMMDKTRKFTQACDLPETEVLKVYPSRVDVRIGEFEFVAPTHSRIAGGADSAGKRELDETAAELQALSILRAARVGDELDRQEETPADGAGAHPKERSA